MVLNYQVINSEESHGPFFKKLEAHRAMEGLAEKRDGWYGLRVWGETSKGIKISGMKNYRFQSGKAVEIEEYTPLCGLEGLLSTEEYRILTHTVFGMYPDKEPADEGLSELTPGRKERIKQEVLKRIAEAHA